MAEEVDEGEDVAAGGGKKKLIMLAGLGAVILILAVVAVVLLFGGDKEDDAAPAGYAAAPDSEHPDPYANIPSVDDVTFYKLPDVLVNLQSPSAAPIYLKLTLTLELDDPGHAAKLDTAMPRVMDRFQWFLRELRPEDLSGSTGSYRLRRELLRRVNIAVAPTQVRAVLIEEMLVQ